MTAPDLETHAEAPPRAPCRVIDEEVRRLLDEAFDRARSIVQEGRSTLELVARALLERETLDRAAFQGLLEARPLDGAPAGQRQSASEEPALPGPAAPSATDRSLAQR